jgi:hypothetical protein
MSEKVKRVLVKRRFPQEISYLQSAGDYPIHKLTTGNSLPMYIRVGSPVRKCSPATSERRASSA